MRKKLLVAAGLVIAIVVTLQCSPVYVLRAGFEEAKILARRTPIVDMIADPATDPETREKLRLVLQARDFAERYLGLDTGDSYTTYSWTDGDTLALVLSAARKDRFEAHTWWFPIVGHVPYKGYFSEGSVNRAADRLESRGYDTFIRPISAFSTLGWFNDPLLSTLLRYPETDLVATVIHELAHNTLYLRGQGAFNESFATFVGERGAIEFFCSLEGEDGERCRRARGAWHDALVFGGFLTGLVEELEALYARDDLDLERRLELREEVFARARTRFARETQPAFRVSTYESFARAPLNNASLMARRIYYKRLDVFDAVFQRYGGDLPASIEAIVATAEAESDDPYAAVARLAGLEPGPGPEAAAGAGPGTVPGAGPGTVPGAGP